MKTVIATILITTMTITGVMATEKKKSPVKRYNQMIKMNPRNSTAFFQRATYYLQQGRYHKAAWDYSIVLELDSTKTMAHLNRAIAHYNIKCYDKVEQDLDIYLETHPADVDALFYKGAVKARTGEYQEALALFDQVIELDGNYIKAYLERGEANFQLENYDASHADWSVAQESGNSFAAKLIRYNLTAIDN